MVSRPGKKPKSRLISVLLKLAPNNRLTFDLERPDFIAPSLKVDKVKDEKVERIKLRW